MHQRINPLRIDELLLPMREMGKRRALAATRGIWKAMRSLEIVARAELNSRHQDLVAELRPDREDDPPGATMTLMVLSIAGCTITLLRHWRTGSLIGITGFCGAYTAQTSDRAGESLNSRQITSRGP